MIYEEIPGGPELLAWFGQEPAFNDAEIISILLKPFFHKDAGDVQVLVIAMRFRPLQERYPDKEVTSRQQWYRIGP